MTAVGRVVGLAGDSLSVGTSSHLKKLLEARGDTLVTSAVVGASTASVVKWARELAPKVDVLCVMAGTNDLAGGAETGWLAKSLVTSLAKLSRSGLTIIVGSPPVFPRVLDEWQAYVSALARECSAAGIRFSQVGAVIAESDLGDGVHPGPAGYARMAGAWIQAIDAAPDSGLPWGWIALGGLAVLAWAWSREP